MSEEIEAAIDSEITTRVKGKSVCVITLKTGVCITGEGVDDSAARTQAIAKIDAQKLHLAPKTE